MEHINTNIPALAHTSMYSWHKFWSRKTWNVVQKYIEVYSKKGDIILDPFSGSGVTAIEGLRLGRKIIISDISPIAVEITKQTIMPINELSLYKVFKEIEDQIKDDIEELYLTPCRNCGHLITFDAAIWEKGECVEIRYKSCSMCGDRREENTRPTKHDFELLEDIEKKEIKHWYPKDKLYYPDGNPFKKKEKFNSIPDLFTKRNLLALSILMNEIEKEDKRKVKEMLKVAFSSMVHLCTRMMPISKGGHFTPFSSAWTQHSYYFAKKFMEQNVWRKFESAIVGGQGLLKCKNDTSNIFENVKMTDNPKDVLEEKSDICLAPYSCFQLFKEIPDNCINYIFTDPPYGSSIQFGELSFLWNRWLKFDDKLLENLITDEVVINKKQGKDFQVYYALLSSSFEEMFRVLKPESYMTVTFHNPRFKIRNATIRAAVFSGFEFQKIHYQEIARPSPKALLQPFGSAVGDFYFRFFKPIYPSKITSKEIEERKFEKIVVDTTIKILAERAEPTPFSVLINNIDPILVREGYFSSLHTGLSVQDVLKNHLENEFKLVDAYIGSSKGKFWWFKDINIVRLLDKVPLSERVEQTVRRKLHEKGRISFTEAWEAVSVEFPNALTTDQTSIKDALKLFARPIGKRGIWQLKREFKERDTQHNDIVGALAEIGHSLGFLTWIGKQEQGYTTMGLLSSPKKLSLLSNLNLEVVEGIENIDVVKQIDVIWGRKNSIYCVFEVESTTSLTSALMRGSNLEKEVSKYIVIPSERIEEIKKKLRSPMFSEHYFKGSWAVILFDDIIKNFRKILRNEVNLEDLALDNLSKKF